MTAARHAPPRPDAEGRGEPVVFLRMDDGSETHRPVRTVMANQILAAAPWRRARSARGQAHFPGYYWAATTKTHVIYESRLELARLLLAEFDPNVTHIAAQPFRRIASVGDRVHRHVPDFFLGYADRSVMVVSVKPARLLAARIPISTAQLCRKPHDVVLTFAGSLQGQSTRHDI